MAKSKPSVPMAPPSVGSSGVYATAYNIKPENTTNFRTAYRTSTTYIPVSFYGDSTMRGVDEGSLPYNLQYSQYAMPMKVASYLNNFNIPATAQNWFGQSGSTQNDYVIRDSRITNVSGSVVLGSNQCAGGTEFRFSGTGNLTFQFTNCNSAEIIWGDQVTTGRSFNYTIDGGAPVNIATSGVAGIVKTTVSLGSVGTHTISFDWVAGTMLLYGVSCYNTNKREIACWQQGVSGGTSATFVANTGTPGAGRLQQLTNFPPKLSIFEAGLVNDWRTSVSVATATANMQTWITAAKALNSDIILLSPPYDSGSTGNFATQDLYAQAMYTLADSNNIGLIDIRKRHISKPNANINGWQRSADNVHLSTAGYDDEALVIASVIMSLTF